MSPLLQILYSYANEYIQNLVNHCPLGLNIQCSINTYQILFMYINFKKFYQNMLKFIKYNNI